MQVSRGWIVRSVWAACVCARGEPAIARPRPRRARYCIQPDVEMRHARVERDGLGGEADAERVSMVLPGGRGPRLG